jgi:hypothetical protein
MFQLAHDFLADALNVGVEEVLEETGEERVAIRSDGFLDALEHARVEALGVVGGLQQEGRNASDDHGAACAARAISSTEARDLTAAHRESHEREVLQREMGKQLAEVFGERIVVVAVGRLARLAEAPAVVGDDAMARVQTAPAPVSPRTLRSTGTHGSRQPVSPNRDPRSTARCWPSSLFPL